MAMQFEFRDLPRVALVLIALAAVVPASAAQDARRPDGTVIPPITAPEPTPRSGYDPGSPARLEQEAARKTRAEENERRLEESRRQREAQAEETLRRRSASGTPGSSVEAVTEQRGQQVERVKRERDAAADTPIKRQ